MSLINKCEITSVKAVECFLHGVHYKFVRMGVGACMFLAPEQLLQNFRTVSQNETSTPSNFRTRGLPSTTISAPLKQQADSSKGNSVVNHQKVRRFNGGELVRISLKCNKPLKRCNLCFESGHESKDCRRKFNLTTRKEQARSNNNSNLNTKTVLCIRDERDDNYKYYKQSKVNGVERDA